MTQSKSLNLLEIHHTFATTKYGKALASRVRYEKYKPAAVANKRWVELLGPDVGNLSHLTFTYELTTTFVEHTRKNQPVLLDDNERRVLQVAALIHDWAEAKTGDISWSDKTAAHEAAEQAAFDEHLHEFYTGDATKLIHRARREVIFDHGSKLGEIFNAVERLGYLITALRAFSHAQAHDAPECEDGLKWIVADVLLNQIPTLLQYAKKYSAVSDYLARKQDDIAKAYNLVDANPTIFVNYAEAAGAKKAQYAASKATWNSGIDDLKTGASPSIASTTLELL